MIKLENLTKVFDNENGPLVAIDRVSLEAREGETCVLLGPSGSGKTTLLKMINRIVEPTSGVVYIDGRDARTYDLAELRQRFGYVIQQIGLFPHMTVAENVSVAPRLMGWNSKRIEQRVNELMELVALDPAVYLKRYPHELSRGSQQRAGIARALAADPPMLLMDEPFGNVDPYYREDIQDQFVKVQRCLRKTILFVSHDIDEAIKLGDRIAVLHKGKLEQFDLPDNILAHPANGFISNFIGPGRLLKRLNLVTVAEAMEPMAPTVRAEDSLEKAASLMEEFGQEHIVLVGPRGRARGVVYLAVARRERGSCGEHRAGLKAMVNVDADLRTAVSLMFTHSMIWLACVDDEGFFKGYLTQHGITQLLGEAYRDAV